MLETPELQRSPLPETLAARVRFGSGSLRAFLAAGTRLRMIVFLLAVVAINYTWSRPSPVDFLFSSVLLLTVVSQQKINLQTLMFLFLMTAWLLSVYVSSISLLDQPLVAFQFVALTSVVLIGISSCLVTTGWTERDLLRFVGVYVFSVVIAATIGTFGFVTQNPDLTWAGRPRAFLDDPDMFGAFLLPGMLGSLFMIAERRSRLLFTASLLLLSVALVLSFSRVAIVSGIVWGGLAFICFNRRNLFKASVSAIAILALLGVACGILYLANDSFAEMIIGRFSLAQPYDLGHLGRYNRYLLAIPMILDNPLGIGIYQEFKFFPEPNHNVWISSFLDYGWIAGFAWTLLMVLSVQQAWYSWRRSKNGLCLLILFSWLSVVSCGMLQEAERWRFMWMLTGMLWGLNYRNCPKAPVDVGNDTGTVRARHAAA